MRLLPALDAPPPTLGMQRSPSTLGFGGVRHSPSSPGLSTRHFTVGPTMQHRPATATATSLRPLWSTLSTPNLHGQPGKPFDSFFERVPQKDVVSKLGAVPLVWRGPNLHDSRHTVRLRCACPHAVRRSKGVLTRGPAHTPASQFAGMAHTATHTVSHPALPILGMHTPEGFCARRDR